jgi:hypothetical protein
MKKTKFALFFLIIMFILTLPMNTSFAWQYAINEVIVMSAGESQQREFKISDAFDLRSYGPLEAFLVIATGESGTLTITLKGDPELDFGGIMDYSLIGMGFSADAGTNFINEGVTTPFTIAATVPINSTFGFAYIGAMIMDIEDVLATPVEFKINFSLSAPE